MKKRLVALTLACLLFVTCIGHANFIEQWLEDFKEDPFTTASNTLFIATGVKLVQNYLRGMRRHSISAPSSYSNSMDFKFEH
jgi:hypothetical protein